MKMNFKYLTMFAAACAVGFSSCSSDDDGLDSSKKGAKTKFSLTIGSPTTYAADANATQNEVTISTVDVFVYENGVLEDGEPTRLGIGAFEETSPNVWTLKNGISTTTGTKTIFVGINLPASVVTSIKENGPDAATSISNIGELKDNNFAMFSKQATTKTLQADEAENNVSVSVSRLVAKVVFFGKAEDIYPVSSGGTLSELSFTTGNVNKKFYPLPYSNFSDPNFGSAVAVDFLQPAASSSPVDAYQAINTSGDIKAARMVYATENTAAKGALQAELTYGIIKGKFTPSQLVKLANPTDGTSALEPEDTPNPDGTFWLVRVNNSGIITNNYFKDEADAKAFAVKMVGDVKYALKYDKGAMYYSVFLRDAQKAANVSEYSVFRNTIYQVTVTGVNGIGSPTDLQGETDPLIPGIIIPVVPPVTPGETTNITVVVSIEPWETALKQENEVLQGQ